MVQTLLLGGSTVFIVLLLSIVATLGGVQQVTADTVVYPPIGPLRGRAVITDGYAEFLGIPFALPPVGELRWHKPVPPPAWQEVRDALEYKPACYQDKVQWLEPYYVNVSVSEDCLYLNVFTPLSALEPNAVPLPVMVFIHGGAFSTGQTYSYTAGPLAKKMNAVIVTIEYRVNIFGAFLLPGMENHNFGLLDMEESLRWVQTNIAAFGGNPTRVTAAGASSGGISIAALMTKGLAPSLFQQALLQSPALWNLPPDLQLGISTGTTSATKGCIGLPDYVLECMRSKSAEEVHTVNSTAFTLTGLPSYGSADLPKAPMKAFKNGDYTPIPVIIGHNQNEGNLFVYMILNKTEADGLNLIEYNAAVVLVGTLFGADPVTLTAEYLADSLQLGLYKTAVKMISDALTVCPTDRLMRKYLSSHKVPGGKSWRYYFTHSPQNAFLPFLGSTHGTEIPYVFNSPKIDELGRILVGGAFTAAEKTFSNDIVSRWGSFVHSGDPGHGWQPYNSETNKVTQFKIPIESNKWLDASVTKHCDYWTQRYEGLL